MTLANKVDQFTADADIAHEIIHGGVNKTVITEGGVVPSFAKVIADKQQEINVAAGGILSQVNSALTSIKSSYYGPLAIAPAKRPDGTARQKGDRYFDTVTNSEMTWNGAAWFVANIDASAVTTQLSLKAALPLALKNGAHSKRITIIGSSSAAGFGATNGNGFAQRMATALTARGWTVANVSIGGDSTQSVINRFYSDVPPTSPDIVLIALTLGNENIQGSASGATIAQGFVDRMEKIASMCRQLGYLVMATTSLPRMDFDATSYQYVRQVNQILENSDIPLLGGSGAVDNWAGQYRAGMWSDSVHCNDIGHEAMFRAVPLSFFDRVQTYVPVEMPAKSYAYVPGVSTAQYPLVYPAESAFGSLTVAFYVRRPVGVTLGPNGGVGIMGYIATNQVNPNPLLRIRIGVDAWGLTLNGASDEILSTRLSSDATRIHLAVRSDYFTNTHSFFVDGVLTGSITADIGTITGVVFGGNAGNPAFNATGFEYDSMAVWRTGLTNEQIFELANGGRIPKAGLCLYSPGVDAFTQQGTQLVNLAPSSTAIVVQSTDVTVVKRDSAERRLLPLEARATALESKFPGRQTWIPAFTTAGVTYVTQAGTFSRIGDRMFFDFQIDWSAAPANTPLIVTMQGNAAALMTTTDMRITNNTMAAGSLPYGYMNAGQNTLTVLQIAPATAGGLPINAATGAGSIRCSGSYPAF